MVDLFAVRKGLEPAAAPQKAHYVAPLPPSASFPLGGLEVEGSGTGIYGNDAKNSW